MRILRHRDLWTAFVAGLFVSLAGCGKQSPPTPAPAAVTPAEARAIAKEAYIYGFPMVDAYRILYAYVVNRDDPEYKGPINQIGSIARVFTPEDKAIQTPNSDTPYSFLVLDLRTEPFVLTVPKIEKGRYFSVQFIDAYTFNFDYVGSRATGNDGGSFLIAGPDWQGQAPDGIKKVIRSETQLIQAVFRTQLFGEADLANVRKIQAGYKAEPLSTFLKTPAPPPAPPIDFLKPLTPEEEKTSLQFFNVLNFVLQFCPPNPSETGLLARFEKIGVGAGKAFDADKLSPEMKAAIAGGITDAWADFAALKKQVDTHVVTTGDLFGTREYLKNNYLYRMAAAALGIFGNSKQEAIYPPYVVDSGGAQLDGTNRYTLRFAPDQLPPVNAFWSLTLYEMPSSLLSANPINRYLINSPMLPKLKRDADGGITLLVQHETPGKQLESNWLPAPAGPFAMAMRLYWPKEEALNGAWKAPPLERVK